MKAHEDIYNFILIKNLMNCSLEKAVKYISNVHNTSFEKMYTWAIDKQKEILQGLQGTKSYEKIEIFHDDDDEQKNLEIALDKKISIYRRIDSIQYIKNRDLLIKLYKKTDDLQIKKEIIKSCKLDEIYELALKEGDESLKIEVIRTIHNRMKLKWAAETDNNETVRIEAVKKITDPHTLQKIILTDASIEVKKAALNQIQSVSVLEAIKSTIPTKYSQYISDRIDTLNGTDDYIHKSIESLIETYH